MPIGPDVLDLLNVYDRLIYENELIKQAATRLIDYHNKLIIKVYPDANVKSHTKGCACEVCGLLEATGLRKV